MTCAKLNLPTARRRSSKKLLPTKSATNPAQRARHDSPIPTTLAEPLPSAVLADERATVSAYVPTPAKVSVPVIRHARQSAGFSCAGAGFDSLIAEWKDLRF